MSFARSNPSTPQATLYQRFAQAQHTRQTKVDNQFLRLAPSLNLNLHPASTSHMSARPTPVTQPLARLDSERQSLYLHPQLCPDGGLQIRSRVLHQLTVTRCDPILPSQTLSPAAGRR